MVKFLIVQGSFKKLGKFPSKYIVADFYEGLCRCRFSVSPVTGNAVSSMYASRESMVLSMVGHLFQNYDTRYVRFFPTYTCNHSCYTIYVRFFVTYTCVLSQLIEWNGYETRQTPQLYVFVDLKVHNVQKNSYHFDCIDQ